MRSRFMVFAAVVGFALSAYYLYRVGTRLLFGEWLGGGEYQFAATGAVEGEYRGRARLRYTSGFSGPDGYSLHLALDSIGATFLMLRSATEPREGQFRLVPVESGFDAPGHGYGLTFHHPNGRWYFTADSGTVAVTRTPSGFTLAFSADLSGKGSSDSASPAPRGPFNVRGSVCIAREIRRVRPGNPTEGIECAPSHWPESAPSRRRS